MAEYIDRKALGIGKCNSDVFENKGYAEGWNSAIEIIENAPAADVVEVVRCRDCKYWGNDIECPLMSMADFTEDDEFCSCGERRKNENLEK